MIRVSTVIIFVVLTTIVSSSKVNSTDKRREIIANLPKLEDLETYLSGLEKAIEFCLQHKLYVDLNLEFGLFLMDVNLKDILLKKRAHIPAKYRFRLEQLLIKTEVLSEYFHFMVKKLKKDKTKYPQHAQDIKITEMFWNKTTWSVPSVPFNIELLKQTKIYTAEQLEKIYGKWDTYVANINDFEKYTPTPMESDGCLENIARVPAHRSRRIMPSCLTHPRCKVTLTKGSDFGYGLSHRILFMAAARFSRRCTVFSEEEDKQIMDKFCMRSFNEAQYIASNSFLVPDLMLEQIALCGLFGHVQFFHNRWLKSLMQFQTAVGCYSEKIGEDSFQSTDVKEDEKEEWTIANSNPVMNGQCNPHLTAVAAASLSQAVRYILETYF
ncbi:UPF0764 protein C16orf89 homolog [Helicoverpa zea]|uniref:UPF0764 protein C16orf89 homolog n=1 Tax=Helicoverpa zea TaxID=7113 RepID=UPI001F58E97D|nr:UPF0764 protein C16orf89 homolog [Helicoverpa zea]